MGVVTANEQHLVAPSQLSSRRRSSCRSWFSCCSSSCSTGSQESLDLGQTFCFSLSPNQAAAALSLHPPLSAFLISPSNSHPPPLWSLISSPPFHSSTSLYLPLPPFLSLPLSLSDCGLSSFAAPPSFSSHFHIPPVSSRTDAPSIHPSVRHILSS